MSKKKFNWHHIKNRRNNIAAFLCRNYVGRPIVGEDVNEISNHLLSVLPGTVSPSAVYETVRLIAGESFSTVNAQEFAWRVAGNVDTLIAGSPVVSWTRQIADEIVPVRVEAISFSKRRNDSGFLFRCRVLAGSPCPMVFPQFLSTRSCSAISHAVGFSHTSWGPFPYAGVTDHFVNMVFFAHIVADRSRETPWFREVSASSSMLKANKELLSVRCRTKACPLGYSHACAQCPLGYLDCGYAVHKTSYVSQFCRVCGKESLFDPSVASTSCLACYKKTSVSCAQ